MDTQTFLNDLKRLAKSNTRSPESSNEFFDYMDTKYKIYLDATPKERKRIRAFINGGLWHSHQIAYSLLMYVKERVLQKLKLTGDKSLLVRGLVAISMENLSSKFDDRNYTVYPMDGDANFLLADLFVTAEESGLVPQADFDNIAKISAIKSNGNLWERLWGINPPMNQLMAIIGKGKLAYERRARGKFVALF